MQFHIQETMSKGLKSTINEQLDVSDLFQGRQDVIRTGPLHVSLQVTGNEGFISVDGELSIDLELACSRCLDPTSEHTVIPFFEQFKPASGDEDKDEEEESDFIEVSGERLDLKPYLEEALLLFMPFAPLCSDDCKGLCQECGQNLNERTCSCKTEKIDPRFAALKDLFKE
ncbi:YceD family protein [Paenibacillus sp. 2TAB19]|uniref:YceD family protein n=1 Tax=Paenibacillus sp. 2TAB19 TaxID=3233003 RepID=UPI003F9A49E2